MLWSDCPIIRDCEKCLEVEFESEKDIACLDIKWADNNCVFEGKLVKGGSRVFVSSEQCLINGDLSIIQVLIVMFYLEIEILWHFTLRYHPFTTKFYAIITPSFLPPVGIFLLLLVYPSANLTKF